MSPRTRGVGSALLCVLVIGAWMWPRAIVDESRIAIVQRGDLRAQITATGVLRPVSSLTYRSPLPGRDVEILELAAEGSRVKEGDLVVRLDTTELQRDLVRAQQELRELQLEVHAAEGESYEAEAALHAVTEGEGALAVDEARSRLQVTERRAERLRMDIERLKPLVDKGFMTRDELARSLDELELAEEELAFARKRTQVVVQQSHPREQQRAQMQLAQKRMRVETLRARAEEARLRFDALLNLIARCRMFAQRPGLVVYEEYLPAFPRRKVRVGDRVTASQGLVTIPEVDHMRVEAVISEAEVHRLHEGQPATVRLEAFPDLAITGRVARLGTLASASVARPLDDRRFDLFIDLDPAPVELLPEMTARADIVVADRRGVLRVPVNAISEEDGTPVAYVAHETRIEARPLVLGESNDGFVEILAGLAEHDRVVLGEVPSPQAADKRHD